MDVLQSVLPCDIYLHTQGHLCTVRGGILSVCLRAAFLSTAERSKLNALLIKKTHYSYKNEKKYFHDLNQYKHYMSHKGIIICPERLSPDPDLSGTSAQHLPLTQT